MNKTRDAPTNASHLPTSPVGCSTPGLETSTTIVMTLAYILIVVVALLGNSFVINVARKRLTVRTPFNVLIINLAVCDIIYAIFLVVTQVTSIFIDVIWFPGGFGIFLCKVKEFAFVLAIFASVLTLTFMAIEKHLAIVYVMRTPLSTKNVKRALLLLWLISCLFASTELYKYTLTTPLNSTDVYCIPRWSHDFEEAVTIFKVEYTVRFFLLFVFPLVILTILYGRIIRFLWKRQLPGNKSSRNEKKIRKQSRRVVLMLVTMTVAFAVGWFPVHVNHYLFFYDRQTANCLPRFVSLMLFWIAHANCAVNPCLYLVFNKDYKDEFRMFIQRYSPCHAHPVYRESGAVHGGTGQFLHPSAGNEMQMHSVHSRTRTTTVRKQ